MKDMNFVWSQTASTDLQEVNLADIRKTDIRKYRFWPKCAAGIYDGLPES